MPDDPALRIFPDEFVPSVQGSKTYKRWARNSRNDLARWQAFRDALFAGQEPAVPSMSTSFGRALVAAGKEHMSISHLIGAVTSPYPPPGTPPTPPGPPSYPQAAPLTISGAGTYSGYNWTSTGTAPAVRVATNEPVVIQDAIITNTSTTNADLLVCDWNVGANLTVERVWFFGPPMSWHLESGGSVMVVDVWGGRAISVESNAVSVTVRNCTLTNTRGIDISLSAGTTLITQNRHINPTGATHGVNPWGNFVQHRVCQGGSYTVTWNEIVSEYGKSYAEDIISAFHTNNMIITDNMLWHQSRPGNIFNSSSQGGITIDASDASGNPVSNCYVARNQVVDGYGITLWPETSSNNNLFEDNRIVADLYLTDGVTQKRNGWGFPLGQPPTGGTGNHWHGNYTHFVDRDGWDGLDYSGSIGDVLYMMRNAPEGASTEAALNTFVAGPVSAADEQAEWTSWQAKLAANNITVGAG